MDQDYIKNLGPEEKDWLNDFMGEYYGAQLDYQNLENNRFHKTPEEKKDCTDRNNFRNRDAYGVTRASNRLTFSKPARVLPENNDEYKVNLHHSYERSLNPEDAMIDYLDNGPSIDLEDSEEV